MLARDFPFYISPGCHFVKQKATLLPPPRGTCAGPPDSLSTGDLVFANHSALVRLESSKTIKIYKERTVFT